MDFRVWLEQGLLMARALEKAPIVSRINVTDTGTLQPPQGKTGPKLTHPFFWVNQYGVRPDIIRWVWNPITGEMRLGEVHNHAMLISSNDMSFDNWLRGFYFPEKKEIAIRPFGVSDNFDPEKSKKIIEKFTVLILPRVKASDSSPSRPIKIVTHISGDYVNNSTLRSRYGKYGSSW
jgi:hypothetical protein